MFDLRFFLPLLFALDTLLWEMGKYRLQVINPTSREECVIQILRWMHITVGTFVWWRLFLHIAPDAPLWIFTTLIVALCTCMYRQSMEDFQKRAWRMRRYKRLIGREESYQSWYEEMNDD